FEHFPTGELALGKGRGGNAVAGSESEAGCGGLVGQHADDFGRVIGSLGGLDQRGHVGAAAGNQDGDLAAAHSASLPVKVTGSSLRSVSLPTTAAVSPEAVRLSTSLSASSGATATSMPTPQLKVRSISRSLMPPTLLSQPKTGGTATAPRSISAAR